MGGSESDHAAPTRTARLNDAHKKQIADNSRAARRKSTIHQYDMYIKRLEWFLKYHGGEVPGKQLALLEINHTLMTCYSLKRH